MYRAAGARRVHEEMLETARDLGTSLWTADAYGNLGEDLLQAGDGEATARYIEAAIANAGDCMKYALRPLIAQAELHLRAGRAEDAVAAARHVAALAPEMRVFVADARCVEGEALARLGRLEDRAGAGRPAGSVRAARPGSRRGGGSPRRASADGARHLRSRAASSLPGFEPLA